MEFAIDQRMNANACPRHANSAANMDARFQGHDEVMVMSAIGQIHHTLGEGLVMEEGGAGVMPGVRGIITPTLTSPLMGEG